MITFGNAPNLAGYIISSTLGLQPFSAGIGGSAPRLIFDPDFSRPVDRGDGRKPDAPDRGRKPDRKPDRPTRPPRPTYPTTPGWPETKPPIEPPITGPTRPSWPNTNNPGTTLPGWDGKGPITVIPLNQAVSNSSSLPGAIRSYLGGGSGTGLSFDGSVR